MLYLLTNAAFLALLTKDELMNVKAVGSLFAERAYGPFAWIMPIFVVMSTMGTVNGMMYTASRLFYVAARNKQMPVLLTMIHHEKLTPVPSILMVSALSLFYLNWSDMNQLIDYVSVSIWLAVGVAVCVLLWLRYKSPHLHRPVKVPLVFPIIYVLATLFIVIYPVIGEPKTTGTGIGIMLTGVPVYLFFIGWKNKPRVIAHISRHVTQLVQRIVLVVREEQSE